MTCTAEDLQSMAFLCVSRGFGIFQHTDVLDLPTVMFLVIISPLYVVIQDQILPVAST